MCDTIIVKKDIYIFGDKNYAEYIELSEGCTHARIGRCHFMTVRGAGANF